MASGSPRAARRPPIRDVIIEEQPEHPLPPRRAALQALAVSMPEEGRFNRLLPLVGFGLLLSLGWFVVPEDAATGRLVLAATTLAFAGVLVWTSRRTAAATPVEDLQRPARSAALPRDFERFMVDGIAASRRRGRTVALLRLRFDIPGLVLRGREDVVETIGEAVRDVTRAYDFVYVPGDGSILVFIAHLPSDEPADRIARRIVEDLKMSSGAASVAARIDVQSATLAQDEAMDAFYARVASEPTLAVTR